MQTFKGTLGTLLAGLIAVSALEVGADDDAGSSRVTYYKDIAPILQDNCQVCHRPSGANLGGMIAPMSFSTYQDSRPWARSIAKVAQTREMPPWHASEEFHGTFRNERTLTEDQIAAINRWAAAGAPAGDPKEAPEPKSYPETAWAIGDPDLVLTMPEEFMLKDDVEDLYQNFTVDITAEQLSEPRWIKSVEFRPGSPVVHHIIGYVLEPGSGFAAADRGMIGGIAPGNDPGRFPEGYGFLLKPGSKFVFAMHYHKEKGPGTATPDRSFVGFEFYPEQAEVKQVHIEAIGNMDFEIPANAPKWEVGMAKIYERPIKVLYLMPHMHLRGAAASYSAFYPDGRTEKLLDVPRYDFNWQTSYEYSEPKRIPAGTRLEVSMWYDNSPARAAEVGFNSEESVRFGGPTTDEMALGWLSYSYDDEKELALVAREAAATRIDSESAK
jgi:mono/diheme cytochrome c family protein